MYFSVCLAKFKHLAVQFILQWLHKHWEQGFRERGELERGGGESKQGSIPSVSPAVHCTQFAVCPSLWPASLWLVSQPWPLPSQHSSPHQT